MSYHVMSSELHLRREFVPNIVNMLVRLGLHPTATNEHKRLSLDLVALVLRYERSGSDIIRLCVWCSLIP